MMFFLSFSSVHFSIPKEQIMKRISFQIHNAYKLAQFSLEACFFWNSST